MVPIIVHYVSNRCKLVESSVMAAEVDGLVLVLYYAYIIRELEIDVLGRMLEIGAFVDRKPLFNYIAKDGATIELRLQIDIFSLRKSYENGEFYKVGWIPGGDNPADSFTK